MVRDYQPSDLEHILKFGCSPICRLTILLTVPIGRKIMILFAVCCHSPKCLSGSRTGKFRVLPALREEILKVFLSARSSAPRGLEQSYCKRQKRRFSHLTLQVYWQEPAGFSVLSTGRIFDNQRRNGSGYWRSRVSNGMEKS